MRDEKKSIDGVLRPVRRVPSQKGVSADKKKLLKQERARAVAVSKARKSALPRTTMRTRRDLLATKPIQTDDAKMGSFVEPEDLEEEAKMEKKQKPVKLSKKGQKKLFKSIQKGKVDPNNPGEIRAFAVRFRRKARAKRIFGLVVLMCLLVAGYFGVKFWNQINGSLNGIFAGGNIFDIVKKDPLKKDIYGRTNVLLFGTEGYDSSGSQHDGYLLTDSMIVASFSEEKGDLFLISLPRDLEVKHNCSNYLGTWYGKLNETFVCGLANAGNNPYVDEITDEQAIAAADELRSTIGTVLGMDIQYSVQVNFTVLVDVVDALGGIEVTIESDDPRGILDRNFDWTCNYQCYFVKYANGEVAHLDGIHALALARARGAAGGYGLPRSNFDREVNQQKILVAIAEKAKQTNFLANPNQALDLMTALGENIRTTFKVSEIRTLIDVAQSIAEEGDIMARAKSIPLLNSEQPQYSVLDGAAQPLAGQFNFTGIHRLVNQIITGQLDIWSEDIDEEEDW